MRATYPALFRLVRLLNEIVLRIDCGRYDVCPVDMTYVVLSSVDKGNGRLGAS